MLCAHISTGAEKRIQTCSEHSRSAAALAKGYLAPIGLAASGEVAGLLHDMGKFTEEFNTYLQKSVRGEKVVKGSVIHTFAGVSYLLSRFHTQDGSLPFDNLVTELLAISIGSHHGLVDLWNEQHQSGFDHRLNRQPGYDTRAADAFHAACAPAQEVAQLYRQAVQEVNQFYAQKLGSYVRSHEEAHFALGLLARLLTSALVDADRTDTRCFMQGVPLPIATSLPWDACTKQINAHIAQFPQATAIQQARSAFSESCAGAAALPQGLYRLDLPTGGGKTLAALRFAVLHAQKHQMQRIFYVAPLLSIIEQNAAVIRESVGDTATVLEHHSNIIRENLSAEEMAQTELLQENWNAPIIVTTLVQLLETMFSGKMAAVRRFHCLCNSVIIIDEVQSLPPKMLSLFNCTINFLTRCCGTTVVLCSATQPAFDSIGVQRRMLTSARLISEELFERYAPLFRRTEITDGGACTLQDIADRAVSSLDASSSVLIVCNTKREATHLHNMLAAHSDVRLFHLSAGMCMAHRKKVLAAITAALHNGERLICVSTQVIEAGIDISFGSVIRVSAGLDSIVQAAGRCNRHGEHAVPQPVCICHLMGEKLGPLREIADAQRALDALLAEYQAAPARFGCDLTSDSAVRAYYTFLYNGMPAGYQDYTTHGHTLFDLLTTNEQFKPDCQQKYYLNQSFRTAGAWFDVFDSASESILTPFGEGKALIDQLEDDRLRYDLAHLSKLLEKAKPYTVSVSSSQIERMQKRGMLYTLLDGSCYVLNEGHYDDQTGVKEEDDSCSTLIL